MINMNKLPRLTKYELFTERMRAVEFFSRTNDIDLYGIGWDKASLRMGRYADALYLQANAGRGE